MEQNSKKIVNTKKLAMSLFSLGLLLMFVGTSYSFFMYSKEGQTNNEMATGTFQVTFESNSEAINLDNAYPMSEAEGQETTSYKFSIHNRGDIPAKYQISILEDEGNTISRENLKYTIKKSTDATFPISKTLNSLILVESKSLQGSATDTYEIKVWLDENATNDAMGQTWRGKIQVVSEEEKALVYEDHIAPTIILSGKSVINLKQGERFNDLGVASVDDNVDKNLKTTNVQIRYEFFDGDTPKSVTEIDTDQIGAYIIYYELLDTKGNKGVVARTVNITQVNTEPPTVTLTGNIQETVALNGTYTDPGATAVDQVNNQVNDILVFGTVNTKVAGDYILKYFAIDKDGNIGSATRIVRVQ